jgi:hypothetical protein
MRTWSRFVVSALLVVGLYLTLERRTIWPPHPGPYLLAVAVLVILGGFLAMLRESSHKTARSVAALQSSGREGSIVQADRVALLTEKLERTLAGTLESGERVDLSVHCGAGQAIVVTDRRALIMRATPFRKSARIRSFPFHTIAFAELRTNLNIQGGRLRIGLAGDTTAGPFAPVRPSWSSDEMKFVDFSLDCQVQMETVAALITGRAADAKAAVPAPA